MAKICISASRQRNDEARTSTFPAGTLVVSVWQGFLWRLVVQSPASASTQSQHLRIQQRSETRGCHSHPTYGEMETDTGMCQIGTTMTGFDASTNASMSVHHTTLDKLVEASFDDEMDRALMKRRHRGAQISLCANSDEPRVEIVPSCVFYRETSLALLSSMMFTVNKSRNGKDNAKKRILTRDISMRSAFFTSDIYDASSTIFADDITKRTVANTTQVINKMGETSRMLNKVCCVGFVTSMRMLHRGKWPDSMEIVSNTESSGYIVDLQLQRCGSEASPPSCGTSRMDKDGTFLECRVFTASQTHYFPQHGQVDSLDRVRDSSAQPCRLQSFRQVYGQQRALPHAVKGKWSLDRRDITRLQRQKF